MSVECEMRVDLVFICVESVVVSSILSYCYKLFACLILSESVIALCLLQMQTNLYAQTNFQQLRFQT